MSEDIYFIIRDTEDGRDVIGFTEKEAILEYIKDEENDWERPLKFINSLPDSSWKSQCMDEDEVIIIKGKIIKPQEKEKVITWEID